MSDLPEQGLLQQRNARPVSGEHLELFGKRAAAGWANGEYDTLNEAVVDTVKQAGLSPEQVRRVIEFTNTDAYLREFKKEASDHKVVTFRGGPADPSAIFQDLNDGGGGSVFDRGTLDYSQPPEEKKASVSDEEMAAAFGVAPSVAYPEVNPLQEVEELRYKLAAAHDRVTDQLGGLENAFYDLGERLYFQVKQASLSGYSLGEVVAVMSQAGSSPEHLKIAFSHMAPRLLQEEVFRSSEAMGASFQKTAGTKIANANHPLVREFAEWGEVLTKKAELRVAQSELQSHLNELTNFMQKAAQGVIPAVTGAAARLGEKAGPAASKLVGALTGSDAAAGLANTVVGGGIKYAPHAAALVGANEIRRNLKYSPGYHKAMSMVNPVSEEYDMREAEIAAQYGQYPR